MQEGPADGRTAAAHPALAVAVAALPPLPLLLQVYKLYGGPHGFMISTGVAEPDADHAATLLRFSLHVLQAAQNVRPARACTLLFCTPTPAAASPCLCLQAVPRRCPQAVLHTRDTSAHTSSLLTAPQPPAPAKPARLRCPLPPQIRLPGQVPVDLLMVLASGPASSGLLGTTSLTYQVTSAGWRLLAGGLLAGGLLAGWLAGGLLAGGLLAGWRAAGWMAGWRAAVPPASGCCPLARQTARAFLPPRTHPCRLLGAPCLWLGSFWNRRKSCLSW